MQFFIFNLLFFFLKVPHYILSLTSYLFVIVWMEILKYFGPILWISLTTFNS